MKRVLLASASALAIVTGSAFAADVIPEPVISNWTGLHIGIGGGAGYNFYDAESESSLNLNLNPNVAPQTIPIISNAIFGDDLGAWYGFGTVEIGFDYQFEDSPIVIGILANYDFNGSNDAEGSSDTSLLPGVGPDGEALVSLNNSVEAELDDSWFLGGRLGFVMNENTLLYGLAGYTWAEGKIKSDHALDVLGGGGVVEIAGTHVDEEDDVDGWTVGAGLEHLITENLSLKVEYRHDFLGDVEGDSSEILLQDNDDGDNISLDNETKVDFSRDTIRAVLSWRFDPFGGM